MTEEKKSQIRKTISVIEVVLAAVMVGYLIYGIATKNLNTTLNNIIAIVVVVTCVVLNDLVEPYLTEVFVNMDDFRREAYGKYVLWDVASMAGLLVFVLNFAAESSMTAYIGLALYFIGSKQKRSYQGAYLGDVTKEDVEAAKAAVVDSEAVEVVQETAENIEE
ncbi:MAG: hypothetical protein IJ024_01000 [Lachnospiraceae bacterium]|nr:hypothetical protein [Lachnospiraceae bacterium]